MRSKGKEKYEGGNVEDKEKEKWQGSKTYEVVDKISEGGVRNSCRLRQGS